MGTFEVYQTLNNLSSPNRVQTFDFSGQTYVYLAGAHASADVDYQTSTFAISAQLQAHELGV